MRIVNLSIRSTNSRKMWISKRWKVKATIKEILKKQKLSESSTYRPTNLILKNAD